METIKTIAEGVIVAIMVVCALVLIGDDNGCSFGLFISLKICAFAFIYIGAKMITYIEKNY